MRAFAVKAVPLILNEILWNVGMNVYFWSYARLDETALPAVTIGEQISTIAAVLATGTSSAVVGAHRGRAGRGKAAAGKGQLQKSSLRWWRPSGWYAWRCALGWA